MTSEPFERPVEARSPDRFATILQHDHYRRFDETMKRLRALLDGRVLWNVNSTPRGGGVAEMLQSLVTYTRGYDIDCRWLVIRGDPDFFTITKRIHNNLHGELGDAGALGDAERAIYEATLDANVSGIMSLIGGNDVVLLHDPQTAGLTRPLLDEGIEVVWRCHVGLDTPNDLAWRAWGFLREYVADADAYIFSRRAFAWEGLADEKIHVIAPSIDAFAPKNQDMDGPAVDAILATSALIDVAAAAEPRFTRSDGTAGTVERRADLVDGGPPPPADAPLVVQVSRWDRLKDPLGVVEGFARYIAGRSDAHLVVAGPSVESIADDPEGAVVLAQARALWDELPSDVATRVHLAALPMDDPEENAAIVNALQRRAGVVVQKSLAEGFGLTVAEAMWKGRPVVASRIGGIQDQMIDGETGLLIPNPRDLAAYGEAVVRLLDEPQVADEMGANGRERVLNEFLDTRQLIEHAELLEKIIPVAANHRDGG